MKILYCYMLMLVAFYTPLASYACSPSLGSPWFTSEYVVDQTTIPSYLEFSTITNTANSRSHLVVNNISKDDVYFVVARHTAFSPFANYTDAYYDSHYSSKETLQYVPLYKDSTSDVYVWYASNYYRDPFIGWLKMEMKQESSTPENKENYYFIGHYLEDGHSIEKDYFGTFFDTTKKAISADAVAIPESKIISTTGDDRPAGIQVPTPTPFTITTIQNGKEQITKGTIMHKLNPTYDSAAQAKSLRGCGNFDHPTLQQIIFSPFILVTLFGIFVTTFGLIYLRKRNHGN